jgi:MinD superfamily P-loop ATPase
MNRKEFDKKIKITENRLKRKMNDRDRYLGVCETLSITFNGCINRYDEGIASKFSKIMAPKTGNNIPFWISERYQDDPTKNEIELRLTFLKLFELHCITNKLYKGL